MRDFDRELIRRVLSPCIIVTVFCVSVWLIGKELVSFGYSYYFNMEMERLREDSGGQLEIDLLVLGNSRANHGVEPKTLEKGLGVNCVINAASTGQPIIATFYHLKEMLENYEVHRVLIGVQINTLTGDSNPVGGIMASYDRLSPQNGVELLLKGLGPEMWLNVLDAYRYKNSLYRIKEVKADNMQYLKAYEDALEKGYTPWYFKGFDYDYTKAEEKGHFGIGRSSISTEDLNQEKTDYLTACIELCKEYQAEVALFTTPVAMAYLYGNVNYQGWVDYFMSYAGQMQVPYYDLNYLVGREEFLPDDCFYDYNHLNLAGAIESSQRFAEILNRADAGEDVSRFFYEDFDALKRDVHRVVAVGADITWNREDSTADLSITSFRKDDVVPLYRIEIRQGEAEYTVLSDWSPEEKQTVSLPYDEDFTIKVTAWTGVEGEEVAWQEYADEVLW